MRLGVLCALLVMALGLAACSRQTVAHVHPAVAAAVHAEDIAGRHQRAERTRKARIAQAWRARLSLARALSRDANLLDGLIGCDIESGARPARSTGDAVTDRLLAVSEQPVVFFIVHGFEFRIESGRKDADVMRDEFRAHVALAQAEPGGSAVCYVSWNSRDSVVAPSNAHLANALMAIRELAADPLVAQPMTQRIVVEGYSAGGNFAMASVLQEALRGDAGPRLRLVLLGTPHAGAPIAAQAAGMRRAGAAIDVLAARLQKDEKALTAASDTISQLDTIENTDGYHELLPRNATIRALNGRFAAAIPHIDFFNVYSDTDEIVPPYSARWSDANDRIASGFRHGDFPRFQPGSALEVILREALSEQDLGADAPAPLAISALGADAAATRTAAP